MIHLVFGVPSLLVIVSLLGPLALPLGGKLALGLVLLVGAHYHLWCRLSSGSVLSPEFPRPVVILFVWIFGTILLLVPFMLVLDVAWVATRLAGSGGGMPDGLRYASAALAALLSAVAVRAAIRIPPLNDLEIVVAGLPPQFDRYRLLHLSDLHISRLFPATWTRQVVAHANALGVDLMVVTGDFIDGTLAKRREDVAPLHDLHAPDGVYAIPGNHEYYFGYAAWIRHLASLGIHMLQNQHVVLTRDGGRLILAGVTDAAAIGTGNAAPDLGAALAGAPGDVPIVLLDHQPRRARDAAARGVALQLSGHTHGGMIRGLDRLIARANAGFVSGRYEVDDMTLYVNNGTALWPGFALRLGRPAELTRLTLRCTATRAV